MFDICNSCKSHDQCYVIGPGHCIHYDPQSCKDCKYWYECMREGVGPDDEPCEAFIEFKGGKHHE